MTILAALLSGSSCISIANPVESTPRPVENNRVRVEFLNGSIVEAPQILERSGQVFLDLGHTVLGIPLDAVNLVTPLKRLANSSHETAGEESPHEGLFRTALNPQPDSVRGHMERIGGAIATVRTPIGLGSGFFIHPTGYLITNDHVIAGEHEIAVTFYEESTAVDGSRNLRKVPLSNVRIVATSPDWDLALLKIEDAPAGLVPDSFPTVPLGFSSRLRRGERVFAVGNPLGLERSVSEGIVSLTNRLLGGRLFVQTTAQINPGNSGGPLLNMRGEVVGVNNMKVVAAGAEGLGFAIPVDRLKEFLGNLDAFAFDPLHPNSGFRYLPPPTALSPKQQQP